jgi:hypothetical protein
LKLEGGWDKEVYVVNPKTNEKQVLWTKTPYHEMADFMYGFTNFLINMNYFPKNLQDKIAPTDSRRRPDQRALEVGDFKLATAEKDRLEEK